MNFPAIDPIAFTIGPLAVRWYSLSYIIGILIGLILINKFIINYKKNITKNDVYDLLNYLILGIIIGGRLGYVFFYNLEFYFYNPFEILKIWNGGMSFHGAVVGIIISIGWFSSKNNKSFFDLTDIICLVSPIGIFFGRIANFINGELYGKVTDHKFGIIFPRGGELPRHPSQLYEAFFEGLILFIILNCLFFFTNLKSKSGIISSLFLILYGIFRFFIETLREPDAHIGLLWNLLSMGQLLCVPMIASGIILLGYVKKLIEQQINYSLKEIIDNK